MKCSIFGCNNNGFYHYNNSEEIYCPRHYQSILRFGHPFGSQNISNKIYLPYFDENGISDNVAAIKTYNDFVFIIDPEDLSWLQYYSWRHTSGYATTTIDSNIILMHRLIFLKHEYASDKYRGFAIDHKNNNTFDNRKCNLRLSTTTQNRYNSPNATYSNIRLDYNKYHDHKYHIVFGIGGVDKQFGKCDTLEEAIEIRNRERDKLQGEFEYSKYLDDGVYDLKLRNIDRYDKEMEELYNSKGTPQKILYIDNRKTYLSQNRKIRNLPEPITNNILLNNNVCCVCGKPATKQFNGEYYCYWHDISVRKYGQPFGYDKYKNDIRNIKIKNFNNTGYSVIITANKDVILIDTEDSDEVFKYNWYINYKTGPVTNDNNPEKRNMIHLSRLIFLNLYPEIKGQSANKKQILFKNGNPLDCRRENLLCNGTTPMGRGIGKDFKIEQNKFRGVSKDNKSDGFVVHITVFSKVIYLGYFKFFEEAVQARLNAEKEYYGETFEQINETNKIYEEICKQVQEWLDSFDPNIQAVRPFYFVTEDPNKYPEYFEKQKLVFN